MKPKQMHNPIFSADGSVLNKPKLKPNKVGAVPFSKKTKLYKYKDHTEIPRPPEIMVMSLVRGDSQGLEWDVVAGEWKSILYRHSGNEGEKQWIGFAMDTRQYRVLLEKNQGMPKETVDSMMKPVDSATWLQKRGS